MLPCVSRCDLPNFWKVGTVFSFIPDTIWIGKSGKNTFKEHWHDQHDVNYVHLAFANTACWVLSLGKAAQGCAWAQLCFTALEEKKFIFEALQCAKRSCQQPVGSGWRNACTSVLGFIRLTNSEFLKGNQSLYFSELWQLSTPSMQEDESSWAQTGEWMRFLFRLQGVETFEMKQTTQCILKYKVKRCAESQQDLGDVAHHLTALLCFPGWQQLLPMSKFSGSCCP